VTRCRYEGDPNRRSTRLPGIISAADVTDDAVASLVASIAEEKGARRLVPQPAASAV
jgi:hypothetical protein